jgi:hypothetical protein
VLVTWAANIKSEQALEINRLRRTSDNVKRQPQRIGAKRL